MNTKISKVVDNKIGENFTYVAPVNMYGARVGDDVFVGPFCEIQKDVYIGDRVRIQSHSFICENVLYMMTPLLHTVLCLQMISLQMVN